MKFVGGPMHGQESYVGGNLKPVFAIEVTGVLRKPDRFRTPPGSVRIYHYYRVETPYLVSQTLSPEQALKAIAKL